MNIIRANKIIFCIIAIAALIGFSNALISAEDPNPFNRIFVPPEKRVTTLADDGIHDPDNPGLKLLQQPKDAFKPLEKSISGNYVDWVQSIKKGQINPLFDYQDPSKKPMPVDIKVVMEVKGTMPDVLFSHKEHTELLDCANCHPQIFVPQKGANQISMAQIMLGQSCGVCHGTVAFPVTECRKCHSQSDKAQAKK